MDLPFYMKLREKSEDVANDYLEDHGIDSKLLMDVRDLSQRVAWWSTYAQPYGVPDPPDWGFTWNRQRSFYRTQRSRVFVNMIPALPVIDPSGDLA